jgi:hypothetical protein
MPDIIKDRSSVLGPGATERFVDLGGGEMAPQMVVARESAGADLTGAYTTPTHTAVNVATATTAIIAANANRKYLLLVNDSDTPIWIKLGANAVANQGIRINANGGSYEMSAKQGNLYLGAVNGIHASTGNKVMLVTEGV